MSITNGYCTLAEFKAFTDIDTVDPGDDAVLEQVIESVSRFIDNETGLIFYADDAATYYYSPNMANMLLVDPLRSITTLKTDDGGDGTYEDTWATTDYHLMPLNPRDSVYHWIETNVNGDYSFPDGVLKSVEIAGNFGYATIPMDIKIICMEISKNVEGRRHGQGTEAVEITAGGVLIMPRDITPYSRKVLNQYRRIR